MMPEPRDVYFDAIEKHLARLQADYAAMKAWLDREKPGWNTPPQTPTPLSETIDYLWQGAPVTFISSVESDGVRMAWVKTESGDHVLVPISELKPTKGKS